MNSISEILYKVIENDGRTSEYLTTLKVMNTFYKAQINKIHAILFLMKKRFPNLYQKKIVLKNIIENFLLKIYTLNLHSLQLTVSDIQYILSWNFKNLYTLNLQNSCICEMSANFLSKYSHNLLRLKELNLYRNRIGDLGLKYLSEGNFNSLTSLNLSNNCITDDGVDYLVQSNIFSNLTNINLSYNQIEKQGAKNISLAESQGLQILNLRNNNVSDEGVWEISRRNLYNLMELNISSNNISWKGAQYLSSGNLNNLEVLNLYGNNIEDIGVNYLTYGGYRGLRVLDLSWNKISEKGKQYINSKILPNLVDFYF